MIECFFSKANFQVILVLLKLLFLLHSFLEANEKFFDNRFINHNNNQLTSC